MHTFNLEKFIQDGNAETRDGHLKVIRFTLLSGKKIAVNLISTHGEAGLIYQIYNKEGYPISINGEVRVRQKYMRLVNE